MEDDTYYEMMMEEYYKMLEEEFNEFTIHYNGEIDYDDWRCLVDVHYRQKHGVFPGWDLQDEMKTRLTKAAVTVGKGLIAEQNLIEEKEQKNAYINGQAQSLMRSIERMLSFRQAIIFDNGFPFNRRFQRIEVWKLEKEDFTDEELEQGEGYNDALNRLADNGLVRIIEEGSKKKFDVFQVVPV
jgi:hypothetical protein